MYKIVFLGSGDLAFGVLQGLLESEHSIVGVLPWESLFKTHWRTRIKRRLVTDTSTLIEQHGLPRLRPSKANSPEFAQQMAHLAPDLLLVASWGEILKAGTIALPKVGCINVHPSLLPRHRGYNPVSSALRAGETETGVTFHHLTPAIDAGDILLQSSVPISPHDNGDSLRRKLSFRAKEMVGPALARVSDPDFVPTRQDETNASYRPKLTPADARIDWTQPAATIHDHVRGCFPWFKCFTHHRGRTLLVVRSEVVDLYQTSIQPGQILYKSGTQLVVATGNPRQALLLTDIQLAEMLGAVRGKFYLARFLHVGDVLQ